MPTLTIKNVPTELYRRLKARAAQNRRSINGEAIICLEQVLRGAAPLDPEAFLASARELRKRAANVRVTDEDLAKMKAEGRV
jgi:plasmid stability protein